MMKILSYLISCPIFESEFPTIPVIRPRTAMFMYICTKDCNIKIVGWIEVNINYPTALSKKVHKSLQKLDIVDSLA
jgi:hypothetical protein